MNTKLQELADQIKKLTPEGQDLMKYILNKATDQPDVKTYEIVASPDGERAGIKCLDCKLTSWNANDVKEKYCGNCHEFHEQKARMIMYPHIFKQP
jgi:hypothetical protein